jgi:hypothetical protein
VLLHGAPDCSLVVILEQTAIIFLYGINWLAFRRVRKIVKSEYWLRHVRPSEWNNTAPTEWFFMKFDI